MLEVFLWQLAKHFQCPPGHPGPWQLFAREYFSVFFHHLDKYQITIFRVVILESIAALVEQDLLIGNNHDELVSLRVIIHDAVLIFRFWQIKYFRYAPAVKPDKSEPGEGRLLPEYPCSYILVDMDEPPKCVTDVILQFLVHNDINNGLAI